MKSSLCFLHQWTGVVFTIHQPGGHEHNYQQGHHHQYPGQQCPQGEEQAEKEEPESQGFFGYLKSLFGRGKSKSEKGEGETSMIGERRGWMSSF